MALRCDSTVAPVDRWPVFSGKSHVFCARSHVPDRGRRVTDRGSHGSRGGRHGCCGGRHVSHLPRRVSARRRHAPSRGRHVENLRRRDSRRVRHALRLPRQVSARRVHRSDDWVRRFDGEVHRFDQLGQLRETRAAFSTVRAIDPGCPCRSLRRRFLLGSCMATIAAAIAAASADYAPDLSNCFRVSTVSCPGE